MKKLIIVLLLAFGGWKLYQQLNPNPVIEMVGMPNGASFQSTQVSRFSCDGRQYCSDMTSRAEAVFFIRNCPTTKMDGDDDGYPCENDSRF